MGERIMARNRLDFAHWTMRGIYLSGALLSFLVGPAHADDAKIKIGVILPITGPASDGGNQEKRALVLEVDQINAKGGLHGHQIELLIEDNQAKPDLSVVAFNKLTSLDDVPVIVSGFSGPVLAMAPLATRKKVLLLNGGAQGDKLADASPYLFNCLPLVQNELGALATFAIQDLHTKTAAILFQNDAGGTPARDDFAAAYTKLGGQIVDMEGVPFDDSNFRAELAKIAAAKPDAVFAMITQNFPQLAQQYLEQKLTFIRLANTNINVPAAIGDPATSGFYHTAFKLEEPPELNAAYKERYGFDMEFYARQFYNALSVVLKATDKVIADNQPVTGENLRAALLAIGTFQGLSGPIVFKGNTAEMGISIMQIQNGKDVPIKVMQ
jgi:branched-chain amino acid transport system substrate-binding protein